MNVKDCDFWRNVFEMTLSNYYNMKMRLERNEKFSNHILVYYSVFLIISGITSKYFPQQYNSTYSSYFDIILSVVLLAFSLINSNSRYPQRIDKINKSANELKTLRLKLCENSIDEIICSYNEIVDKNEMRDDVDFFRTLKKLCCKNDIDVFTRNICIDDNDPEVKKRIKFLLLEVNPFYEQTKIILAYISYFVFYLIPIFIFLFIFKLSSTV